MLDFNTLSLKNARRCERSYHAVENWTPTDWGCALAGEVGEACNFIKKLKRETDDQNLYPNTLAHNGSPDELIENIGKELADVVIYADLLATRLGLKLGNEVVKKFNETSVKIKSDITL